MKSLARHVAWLAMGCAALAAGPATQPAARIAQPTDGLVVIWGGGAIPGSLSEIFAKAAAKRSAIVVIGSHAPRPQGAAWAQVQPDAVDAASRIASADAAWVDAPAPAGREVIGQVLVDPGFLQSPEPPALLQRLQTQPGLIGVGVPAGSGLLIRGRRLTVEGKSAVVICLPASVSRPAQRPVFVKKLHRGEEADLIALSRAAIARLGPAFPPDAVVRPDVPDGTVLACGGGDLPDAIWQRFIDLAGGPDAPIVVLPIAQPNPDETDPPGLDALKKFGCKHLTVLNQHTHRDVESPEFARALREARGVWFVGGRQWKYVDAYAGTPAEEWFRDVLRRGGVIGGSSAGAAIQADYMVRGDPLGNKDISAEGYEQGLDFLPGTTIDIHVSQRGRLSEMTGLIRTYPQLLGIALDEQTAVEVHGHLASVLGTGSATFVDADSTRTVRLTAGARYDLAERKTVQKGNTP
jgi:cyanophycinase